MINPQPERDNQQQGLPAWTQSCCVLVLAKSTSVQMCTAVGRAAALARGPAHLLWGRKRDISECTEEHKAHLPPNHQLNCFSRQLYRALALRQKEQGKILLILRYIQETEVKSKIVTKEKSQNHQII